MRLRRLLRKIKHKRQEFNARMQMERDAQHDTAARLQEIEMRYQTKIRQTQHRNR